MKALLLAGGLGTRLRPLTFTRPKHLLPIANRPHIEHICDLCLRHGISEVVLLTSYLAESFAAAVKTAELRGMNVEVTHEAEPLGTAGAIKNAEELVGSDSFLAMNADILTNADLGSLLAGHREHGAEATILLTPVDDPSAFGVVPTDDEGGVLGFIEKPQGVPPTNLINAGIYVLEPSILTRIPAGEVWSAERQLFPGLVDEGAALYAFATHEYWTDIGTPEKYLQANVDALEGRYTTDAVPAPAPGGVVAARDVKLGEGARVSSACLGAGVVVEERAVVEHSVLLDEVIIGAGAVVRGSILGSGVRVAPGAEIVDRTVADSETL
ncbi:MAG: sugar phosphate nucleotidyltransferase [Actinomycetota bacterium]